MTPLIPILIDDRERAGPVPDALVRTGIFDPRFERLTLGDYLVDGRFLFERKTLPDLVQSIKDGRLFSQALRLAESPLQSALILEGTGSDLDGSGMRWEAIQGRSPCSSGYRCCAAVRLPKPYAASSSPRGKGLSWPAVRFPVAASGQRARWPCSSIYCKACPASGRRGRPACSNASARWKR